MKPNRRRVIYLIQDYPVGTQTFVEREFEACRSRSLVVDIYALRTSSASHRLMRDPRVDILKERLPLSQILLLVLRFCRAAIMSLPLYLDRASILRFPLVLAHAFFVVLHISRVKYSEGDNFVIHCHFMGRTLDVGYLVARVLPDVMLSVTGHAGDVTNPISKFRLEKQLRAAARVFAASNYLARFIEESFGRTPEAVIRCGLPSQYTGRRQTDVTTVLGERASILFVGRLVEKKGVVYLLRAFRALSDTNHEELSLTIVGDGPLRQDLESEADRLGVLDRVRFLGSLPVAEVSALMRRKNQIFALPAVVAASGDEDGIPVVLMEAMACGIPVVSTAVAGIPELVIDGKTGLLVAERSVDNLALAISSLMDDPKLVGRLVLAAAQIIDNEYTIERQIELLVEQWGGLTSLRKVSD